MGKRILSNRVVLDPDKINDLIDVLDQQGLSLADISREIGRSYCYISNIKNCILRGASLDAPSSKNSIQKLEYDYIVNKYGVDIKYELPVKEVKVPTINNKDVPVEQTDIYIAVYFGVLDALKDFYKESKKEEVVEEEPKKEVKIVTNESPDEKKIISQETKKKGGSRK